jgi:hypothetical protein
MTTSVRQRASLLPLAALLLGACVGAAPASPSGSPAGSSAPSAASTAPATPDPNTSTGTDVPPSDPGIGNGDPGVVEPTGRRLVVPKPGQLDIHPISAEALTTVLDGRRVVVTVAYTSGVEPCYVLDSIVVDRGDTSFAITLREGHGPGDVACIEIAEMKRAQVDLGELQPGTYTITDGTGGAAPIEVVVT